MPFFFGDQLKNLAKTSQRPFFTGLLFSFLYLFNCPGFLSKKYGKSNYNILENWQYLYLKIIIILCSAVICYSFFLIQRPDSLLLSNVSFSFPLTINFVFPRLTFIPLLSNASFLSSKFSLNSSTVFPIRTKSFA